MATPRSLRLLGQVVLVAVAACADDLAPTAVETDDEAADRPALAAGSNAAPVVASPYADLVTRDLAGTLLTFWPYTGRTPVLGDAADPVNLILVGDADPRTIRERLFALDGDRSAFGLPPVPPFDCTWSDAIGASQGGYAESHGWAGGVVQLQCGAYETIRVHVRLFRVGAVTLANAHLDVRIPGTADHEVVSWSLSRLVAALDLQRIGGTPVGVATGITETPTYRTVNPAVFGGLPADLLGLLTTPPAGLPASTDPSGNLLNDGNAPVLSIPEAPAGDGRFDRTHQTVDIGFDQVVPRPFCHEDGQEFLEVRGPVRLTQTVTVLPTGAFQTRWDADGDLEVRQVHPAVSEWYRATVKQRIVGMLSDRIDTLHDTQFRMEIRPAGEQGRLSLDVRIGPDGRAAVRSSNTCR